MFFKYKVHYYNEYDDTEPTDTGLVWAEDYGEAVNKVVNDYGEDSIEEITIKDISLDDSKCISKEDIDYAFE